MKRLSGRHAAIGVVLLWIAANGAWAQSQHLVFTEESSAVLTSTLDGKAYGTVKNTSFDHWSWVSPKLILGVNNSISLVGDYLWSEPGVEVGRNQGTSGLQFIDNGVAVGFDFVSDAPGPSAVPDGGIGGTISIIADGTILLDADVRFFDRGDVPDSGWTFGMLLVAVTGLGAARLGIARA